ncbi:MAG: hypothetical protein EOP83_14520 [Verrucomicrobiaceae bacterium]|nr:MAG: hypothetical protein EOP83_14520 [Verrucomicrobiaceae bacterium]
MSFTVRLTTGTALAEVADQTIVTTECPISLVGRGAVNYAQAHAENFVHLLENFANTSAPASPVIGQQWYDTVAGQMKFWNGSSWLPVGGGGTGATGMIAQGSRLAGFTGAVLATSTGAVTVGVMLSEGVIIGIVSNQTLPVDILPPTVVLDGVSYNVASRFTDGVKAGMTFALSGSTPYQVYVTQ